MQLNALPTGIVTFLFTDIEGSTIKWEHHPTQMEDALSRHHAIMREAMALHGGVLFETAGDSFVVAFASAPPALETALWAQRALNAEAWPVEIGSLKVRMSLHTGPAEMRPDGYYAQHTLSRQSRLLVAGHGGQILVSQTTFDLLKHNSLDGVGLRDMGELHLKDLSRPERVFQVVASASPWSLPSDFPPLRSVQARPNNLPKQALPFVGREKGIEEIIRQLAQSPIRLLTLLGPGGIGKTRLALQVAGQMLGYFNSGVFFVDLTPITDPDLVIPTIANTLGLHETDGRSLADLLKEYLEEKDLLLVLDNLEQVTEAAPYLADLLTSSSKLKVLATSRVPLRILLEHQYSVVPLGLPDIRHSTGVAELSRSEAIALFVERAQFAKPSFELNDANVGVVATICLKLEGIPLGLVLAAARLKVLTPQALLSRLSSSLTVLTGGARDMPTRHQTLRDTIEWSYNLLDMREQALYRRISIFMGGFSMEAAEAICALKLGSAPLDALDGVSSLVDKSLAYTVEGYDGEIRYKMLEVIRDHALEKLEQSGEDFEVRAAGTRYFMGLAEEGNRHLFVNSSVEWLSRLEDEHDNFRGALLWSADRGKQGEAEGAQLAARTSAGLVYFWHDRTYFSEGCDQLELALGLTPVWSASAQSEQEAKNIASTTAAIHNGLGLLYRVRGGYSASRQNYEKALAIYRETGDLAPQPRILSRLGVLAHTIADYDEAEAYMTESLELARSLGNEGHISNALHNLGNVVRDKGNYEQARTLYTEALQIATVLGDLGQTSASLNNLANLALQVNDYESALDQHRQGLLQRAKFGNKLLVAESLIGIASVEVARRNLEKGAYLIGYAEEMADSLGGKFDPMERRVYESALAVFRESPDAASLDRARQEGHRMSLEDAIQYALTSDPAE